MDSRRSAITVSVAGPCRLVPFPRALLKKLLAKILADHGLTGTLSVAVVDDARIGEIHRRFLGKDGPTDVISFPLKDGVAEGLPGDGVLGELVVSAETARREARRRGLPPERELFLYAVHGALHLAGYDDKTPTQRRAMRRKEWEYLKPATAAGSPPRGHSHFRPSRLSLPSLRPAPGALPRP